MNTYNYVRLLELPFNYRAFKNTGGATAKYKFYIREKYMALSDIYLTCAKIHAKERERMREKVREREYGFSRGKERREMED